MALPAPMWEGDSKAYVAPRTQTEEVLAGIWAQMLGVVRVGVEDDFFELGGHSLIATRVMSRVREAFKVEVPLRSLFEHRTVGGFSEQVDIALRAGPTAAAAPPLVRVRRKG